MALCLLMKKLIPILITLKKIEKLPICIIIVIFKNNVGKMNYEKIIQDFDRIIGNPIFKKMVLNYILFNQNILFSYDCELF